jgi:hypothetical protein
MDRRDPLVPRVALERCAPPGRQLRWVAAALLLTAPSTAQIDRINHHQWSWLMQRRLELLVAVRDRPAEVRDAVAVALTRVDEAVPLLTWARAMALVRGVEADAGFCFRAGLQLMALPEVVSKETFDHVAVTVYAPHLHLTGKLPKPKRFGFEVVVSDASGAVVHRGEIRESEDFSSLREFRTVYKVPTAELADGTYRVRVDTVLEGTGPRPHDVGLEVAFHVLAGYKARAEAFRVAPGATDFVARADEFAPLPRAQLLGAAAGASRPFDGTPGVDPGFAVRDLLRAERILANLGQGRAAFDGLSGYVETALPAGEGEVIYASLRLPPTGLPAPSSWARGSAAWQALARRPLLLMMGRLPSWDVDDRRPSARRRAVRSGRSVPGRGARVTRPATADERPPARDAHGPAWRVAVRRHPHGVGRRWPRCQRPG